MVSPDRLVEIANFLQCMHAWAFDPEQLGKTDGVTRFLVTDGNQANLQRSTEYLRQYQLAFQSWIPSASPAGLMSTNGSFLMLIQGKTIRYKERNHSSCKCDLNCLEMPDINSIFYFVRFSHNLKVRSIRRH